MQRGKPLLIKEIGISSLKDISPNIPESVVNQFVFKTIQVEGNYPEVVVTAAESTGCRVYSYKRGDTCGLIISGSKDMFEEFENRLPSGLKEEFRRVLTPEGRKIKIGNRIYDLSKRPPLVMGILNVTPDSFSDGGRYFQFHQALKRALALAEEGADIIDVGGESTRPGSEPVSLEEERRRVIPLIKEISREVDIPISVDTYKPEIAREALEAGASLINDIYGLRQPGMLNLIEEVKVPVVIMHMQGTPRDMQKNPFYEEVVSEVATFLVKQAKKAEAAGLSQEEIIIDPGIGFGKTLQHNLSLLSRLEELTSLGYPLLIGHSRKSFIGLVLDEPVEERLEGSLSVSSLATIKGASILRVHDVKANIKAIRMAWSIGKEG